MQNFEHEYCPPPQARAERAFLLSDYFHDSHILSVDMRTGESSVIVTLWCEREWRALDLCEQDCGIRLHGVRRPPPDEQRPSPTSPAYGDYLYRLTFGGVLYTESALPYPGGPEYLNGRFKRSARLAELQQRERRRLRHLRIQASDGYLDLIYQRVDVERLTGAYKLVWQPRRLRPFSNIAGQCSKLSRSHLRVAATKSSQYEAGQALTYLTLTVDHQAAPIARAVLDRHMRRREFCMFEWDLIAAIWTLGQLGGRGDLERLWWAHSKEDDLFWQRHVRDAIEWIQRVPTTKRPRSAEHFATQPAAHHV